MKTITLPVHNRPEYLKRVLNSISNSYNLSEFTLLIGCEPENRECIELAKSFSYQNKAVIVNNTKKGVRKNPYDLLQTAFVVYESQINFHVEEDVEFSPDCLNLTNWFLEQDPKYGLLTYFNRTHITDSKFEQLKEYQIGEGQHNFTPFIWSMRPEKWSEIVETNAWWNAPQGWDYSLVEYMKNAKWTNLIVECTRANHIGEYGTYMDPKLFAEHYGWRQYAANVPNNLSYKI